MYCIEEKKVQSRIDHNNEIWYAQMTLILLCRKYALYSIIYYPSQNMICICTIWKYFNYFMDHQMIQILVNIVGCAGQIENGSLVVTFVLKYKVSGFASDGIQRSDSKGRDGGRTCRYCQKWGYCKSLKD